MSYDKALTKARLKAQKNSGVDICLSAWSRPRIMTSTKYQAADQALRTIQFGPLRYWKRISRPL